MTAMLSIATAEDERKFNNLIGAQRDNTAPTPTVAWTGSYAPLPDHGDPSWKHWLSIILVLVIVVFLAAAVIF